MIHFLVNLNTLATLLLVHALCVTVVILCIQYMPAKKREILDAHLLYYRTSLNLSEQQVWNIVYLSMLFAAELVLINVAIGRIKRLLMRFF